MRHKLMEILMRKFLLTFPPFDKNGNGKFGDFKRWCITVAMHIVGGDRMEEIMWEVHNKWMFAA